jgi:DUF1680 family protein
MTKDPVEYSSTDVAPHGDGIPSPVVPSRGRLQPLGLDAVRIHGGFWGDRQELNARAFIPHCEEWVERMGWVANFDAALEGRLPQDRRGREFSDSDVYKLLEAMAWEIGRSGDAEMDHRLRSVVGRIAPVQEADGYLNTMFGRPGQAPRYSDLAWGHELYCFGHIIQAGVARARTSGQDQLFQIARRAADHVCETFGPGGLDGIGGHPEIEVALAELARCTGESRYLDQARLFVDRRGNGLLGDAQFGRAYFQDDLPFRDATVMRGHAVRALYLAAGAVDVAVETGDGVLLDAATEQTLNTLARRTYVTGGMGAHHEGESFGLDFELPADRAYSETCAGVGSVMVNQRLLLATGNCVHADAVERTLYNVVAGSPGEDGRSFFYTNTLHQRVPGHPADASSPSPRAAASMRAPWYEVACCPTNVARTLASLGAYVATRDDEGIQILQYVDADLRAPLGPGRTVALRMDTDYPADGRVRLTVLEEVGGEWTLSLRVPAWAGDSASLTVGGEQSRVRPGLASVTRAFEAGEQVELHLPVEPRWTWPDSRIDAVRGCVAVEQGPRVLCLESNDLGADVARARVAVQDPPRLDGTAVRIPVSVLDLDEETWPYEDHAPGSSHASPLKSVSLVPYHSRANRGPSTMRVWIPIATSAAAEGETR